MDRQNFIPATVPPRIVQLDKMAQEYESVKNDRVAIQSEEKKRKAEVERYMIENDIKHYRLNRNTVLVIEDQKQLKLIKQKQDKTKRACIPAPVGIQRR